MAQSNDPLSMKGSEWALLLVLSFLWGGSFFFFKVLVAEFPPFTVVLGRVGLAALALNVLLLVRGEPLWASARLWGAFCVMGLLNNIVPFTLIVFGEARLSSGLASILNATTPIFTVVVAHVWTSTEKLTWAKAAGIGFGFLGVAVLVGPDLVSGLAQSEVGAEAACLLAAATYAFAGLYGRRFRGISPLIVATGQTTASTALLIPLTLIVDRPWTLSAPSAQACGAWVGIALFSTALAYVIYFRILAEAGATNLLLVTFLLPVSALLLGAVVLHETLGLRSIEGMALISLGLAAIDGRVWNGAAWMANRVATADPTRKRRTLRR